MLLSELFYIEPYLWLSLGSIAILFLGLLPKGTFFSYIGSLIVLVGTIVSAQSLWSQRQIIENFIFINHYTLFWLIFFSIISAIILFLSHASVQIREKLNEIYYSLILFTILGMVIILSDHLIAVLLGLKLIALCSFCLAMWNPERPGAVEATTKFIFTSGIATGFLLLGITCIYFGSGTIILSQLLYKETSHGIHFFLTYLGLVMLIIGVSFELGMAPFHNWLADIYEGAPTPIVLLIGGLVKISLIAWLLTLPRFLPIEFWNLLAPILLFLALTSLIIGTILALKQTRLKRFLAYSSTVHFGFLFIPLSFYQTISCATILYYSLSYIIALIALLAIIITFEKSSGMISFKELKGFGHRSPLLSFALSCVMLSLAGIPPLTGFFAKLFIFEIAIINSAWLTIGIMAIASAIGVFYYIRVILILYDKSTQKSVTPCHIHPPLWQMGIISLSVVSTMLFGVFSQPILTFFNHHLLFF